MFKIQYDMNIYKRGDIQIEYLKKPPILDYNKKYFEDYSTNRKKTENLKWKIQQKQKQGKHIENKYKLFSYIEKTAGKLTKFFIDLKNGEKYANFYNINIENRFYFRHNKLNIKNPGFFREDLFLNKNLTLENIKQMKKNKPVKIIYATMKSNRVFRKMKLKNICIRESMVYPYNLNFIHSFFDVLEPSGNFFTHTFNYCKSETIEFVYLLALLFEYVVINDGIYIYCHNFLPNYRLNQKDVYQLIKHRYFDIKQKPQYNEFIKYITSIFKARYINVKKGYDPIINIKFNTQNIYFELFDLIYVYDFINKFNSIHILDDIREYLHNYIKNNSVLKFINHHYTTLYIQYLLYLKKFVKKYNHIQNILEIDIGWGIQTLFLLNDSQLNLKKYDNFDFNQSLLKFKDIQWVKKNICTKHKNIFKFSKFNPLSILPKFIQQNNSYDLILINNMYNSDDFMLKFIYFDQLVKPNGFIFIYNILNYKFINFYFYVLNEYKNYKIIFDNKNILVLQKII
jgi:hypothetical protein